MRDSVEIETSAFRGFKKHKTPHKMSDAMPYVVQIPKLDCIILTPN